MRKSTSMQRFINEAEEHFDSYDGGFIGAENDMADYVGGYDEDYFNGDGGLGAIDSADRTLTVNITNTDTANTLTAVVFGAYEFAGTGNSFQPAGVTVAIPESSHDQVRSESASNPFLIKGFKYIVTNVAQFSNTITHRESSSAGVTTNKPLQPNSYRSAQNQIATQIDAPEYILAVDGKASLLVPMNPSESITFIFNIKTRGNIGELLKGKAVLDMARHDAPTGLPQIDLKQGRRK